jgi:hypothetical protein
MRVGILLLFSNRLKAPLSEKKAERPVVNAAVLKPSDAVAKGPR